MGDGRRYWAFLSYSHQDRAWATWLHRALEAYALPRRLVGRASPVGPAPARFRPVFKDRDELAVNTDLRARVHAALAASSALIVICSPAAARSAWVEDEIIRFKSLHGEARVFAVIVAGTPNAARRPGAEDEECFPAALRFHLGPDGALTDRRAEIIAADLRPEGDGRALARLKLIAGILGFDLDELVQRDAHRRGQQLGAIAAASLVGAAAMGGLALAALASRDEARAQRAQAESLVEFMLGDLRKKLEPTGRLDVLDAVGARAMAYYAAQARRGLDAEALGRRARVLHMLGDLSDQRGDLNLALKDFQQAAAVTAELLARRPTDTTRLFNHAQSVYWVGYVAYRRGQDETAEKQFLEYRRLADRLVSLEPKRDEWRMEVGYANANLGALLQREGRADLAADAFSKVLLVDAALAAKAPADRDRQMDLAGTYHWLGDAEAARGRLDWAMRDRRSERAIYDEILRRRGGDNAAKLALVINGIALAKIDTAQGRIDDAITELRRSADQAGELMALEPDDANYREQAAFAFTALSRAFLAKRSLPAAASAAKRGVDLAESLVRKDPSDLRWRGVMLGGARLAQIKVDAQAARSTDALRSALAPAVGESDRLSALASRPPANPRLARVAAEAALLAGDHEGLAGRDDLARARWEDASRFCAAKGPNGVDSAEDRDRLICAKARDRLGQARFQATAAGEPKASAAPGRDWLGGYSW
ncbi:MAG: TIR domain-containing protein [Caulobacteraceae bacterium]